MVISDEFRFPLVLPVKAYRQERKVVPVDAVASAARLGVFKREWERDRDEARPSPRRQYLNAEEEREVRSLVAQANRGFERNDIFLRLLLTKTADGYLLDIYDCASDEVSLIITDLTITIDELPTLLRNLEKEMGLLVDTVT